MRYFLLVLSALILASPAGAKTIYYGGRAGMEVTIVKKSGIGTSHASVLTKHTRQNAIGFCREYVGKVTEDCIAKELKTPLHLEITADCKTGRFTTFYGANMLFLGRSPAGSATDYLITDTDENVVLDGSGASGYDYTIEQFQALCPNRVR
ncbi:hypothetical protein RFN29_20235 [Mesorhizobium sp. VK22B]|uniref:DUF3617 family protein n=1 Tax=Mesorhizobium captivum TaxID=3072319 RepID=A0ABU4Z5P4_9HYPH|nr:MULTISPECIES: hypothetical protein [unclassified Mesorhizobium]MDX8493898.1 hypothetical protein [Mesorhizobium sp. VK22B]MDX8507203.1 hypothetical protein [Mesorhizobium sp. VK22E]